MPLNCGYYVAVAVVLPFSVDKLKDFYASVIYCLLSKVFVFRAVAAGPAGPAAVRAHI